VHNYLLYSRFHIGQHAAKTIVAMELSDGHSLNDVIDVIPDYVEAEQVPEHRKESQRKAREII